jgi:acyl-CoA synthetase (AMP-forming)/AMP-acid ligase II
MNIFDYLFEHSFSAEKDLILGPMDPKSYRDVFQESGRLAAYIRRKIGRQKKIILATANSPFFVVAYLGILKSGNVCIPLNPQIESEVFEFIKKKTAPDMLFISESLLQHMDPDVASYSEIQLYEILKEEKETLEKEPDFDGSQLAAIMFTSGSTALPKGVMLSHDNLIANTDSIIKSLSLKEEDIMMVVLPFYYCYGLSLLNTHIRVGGSVVLNNNFIFFSQTIQYFNTYRCTGFAGVPSHFQLLLRKTDLFRETPIPSLRYVTQAGGRLHDSFILEFMENFPTIKFFVMYGQTEATARLSALSPELLPAKIGSMGKGIPGVELKVVNEEGTPVSPGEVGEIVVRGKNIMMGYFDDPVSTAEVLRDGWLHTGDLATVDEEGYVFITARKKEIIKIGGIRISPREIEEVIVKMNGIVDCTAEAVDDELLGEAIKVTVVINEHGKKITPEDIKRFCGTRLASYKIPTHFVFHESMVLSPSGKKVKPVYSEIRK